jgi:hypothetical protein
MFLTLIGGGNLRGLEVTFKWMEFIFCENRSAGSREEERGHTGFVEM